MNVEINFTYLNMGLSLCLVCNFGEIRGRFRRVFGSVLFAVLHFENQSEFPIQSLIAKVIFRNSIVFSF